MTRRVVVLVCGEPERGDDGVAFRAVDGFEEALGEAIEIRRCGTLEVDDLVGVGDGETCLLVDTVVGIPPGEVVVRPLASLVRPPGGSGVAGAPRARPIPRSTHLLPVDDVLALAAIVRPSLPNGTFVGIGGASFGLGEPISPAVAAGLPAFVRAIAAEAARLAATEGSGRP